MARALCYLPAWSSAGGGPAHPPLQGSVLPQPTAPCLPGSLHGYKSSNPGGQGTKQALRNCRQPQRLTALWGSILGRSMAMVIQFRKMMTRTTWSNILWVMIR